MCLRVETAVNNNNNNNNNNNKQMDAAYNGTSGNVTRTIILTSF